MDNKQMSKDISKSNNLEDNICTARISPRTPPHHIWILWYILRGGQGRHQITLWFTIPTNTQVIVHICGRDEKSQQHMNLWCEEKFIWYVRFYKRTFSLMIMLLFMPIYYFVPRSYVYNIIMLCSCFIDTFNNIFEDNLFLIDH